MPFDDACHVRHAAVAEFHVEFVANFVEAIVWGEVLVDEVEELFANICFDFNVGSWIEPGDVSLSCSLLLAVWWSRWVHGVCRARRMPRFSQSLGVRWNGVVKRLTVT